MMGEGRGLLFVDGEGAQTFKARSVACWGCGFRAACCRCESRAVR